MSLISFSLAVAGVVVFVVMGRKTHEIFTIIAGFSICALLK
jgi:hypothetical protein